MDYLTNLKLGNFIIPFRGPYYLLETFNVPLVIIHYFRPTVLYKNSNLLLPAIYSNL